ncbi:Uncharacterised protein [Raoultella terrigena]|uniref:Uncharacterized protein n=1 Tax=Raoultella terrigena TaxID=577 RepID=A0A4U9D9Q6_RAOTE|nr:Uncharacterised protein [Raoultella terrigena]
MTTSELRKQKIILLPEALPYQECTTIIAIVYQTLLAELIQVRPNGGNFIQIMPGLPHIFTSSLQTITQSLKNALPRQRHHRTGVLMDNDIRTRKTVQNRLLHLVGNDVCLNQWQVIFHFQMYLNKASRP